MEHITALASSAMQAKFSIYINTTDGKTVTEKAWDKANYHQCNDNCDCISRTN